MDQSNECVELTYKEIVIILPWPWLTHLEREI